MDYLLSDGSFLSLPDDLTEEEIQERIQNFESKFLPLSDLPPKTPIEEETLEATPLVPKEPPLTIENPYVAIAPNLRPPEFYDEGDPALFSTDLSLEENLSGKNQILAGAASTALAQLETLGQDASLSNIGKLQNRLTALKQEINDFETQGIDNLNPEEKKKYQDIYNEEYGVGVKPTDEYTLEDYYNQMGFGGDSAFGQQIGSKLNRIEELGLEGYVNELTQTISSLDKAVMSHK